MSEPASTRALREMIDQLGAAAGELLVTGLVMGMGILAVVATLSLGLSLMATASARVRAHRVQRSRHD